jgi:hypothetical protein
MLHPVTEDGAWYGVRCVFRWCEPERQDDRLYEERITLWRAHDFDEAIAKAEQDALAYVAGANALGPDRYLDLAQAYRLDDEAALEDGVEVFSLLRRSSLKKRAYLDTFFTTGGELEGEFGEA